MRIDLNPSEVWENTNDKIKSEISISKDHSIRTYRGLAQAVFELAFGTAQYFSHKKSAGVIQGNTNAFMNLLPFLYKEAYQIQLLDWSDASKVREWVESLKKDTNFVLFSEDHPVTAELFAWQELDQLLNEKKIFSIRVSHHAWKAQQWNVLPYSLQICSVNSELSFAVIGSKFKTPTMIAHGQSWNYKTCVDEVKKELSSFYQSQQLVEKFESQLPKGWLAYLQTKQRVFDRSVIYNPQINSDAILHGLQQKLPHLNLESMSLCHWGGMSLYKNWWKPLPNEEITRGMLILGAESLQESKLIPVLQQVTSECEINYAAESN